MPYLGNLPGVTTYALGVDRFSANGTGKTFTLSRDIDSALAVDVHVSGVWQEPITAYTVNNGVITFISTPAAGSNNVVAVFRDNAVINYNQVSTSQIETGAITSPKLASNLTISGLTVSGNLTVASSNVITGNIISTYLTGYNQSLRNMTSSRAIGTTYTNNTGRPIMIFVNITGSTSINWSIGGTSIGSDNGNGIVTLYIPAGSTYGCTLGSGTPTLVSWFELR